MYYTYHLFHKPTLLHYYGVRIANSCEPKDDLWIKYFSSSKNVHNLIKKYGKDSFDFEIRKLFNEKDEAISWETRVLKKLKVLQREDWLNYNISGYVKMSDAGRNSLKIKMSGSGNNFYGKKHTTRVLSILREKNCHYQYKFLSPSGEEFVFNSLVEFCKKNKLNLMSMNSVVNGKYHSYKGWSGVILGKENLRNGLKKERTILGKDFFLDVTSPSGEQFYSVSNLHNFCKVNNLPYRKFRSYRNKNIDNGSWIVDFWKFTVKMVKIV